MTEDELLDRIDRHMARGNEIMADSNEIMADSNQIMADSNEIMREHRESIRDHREFIREMTVRQERVTQQLVERLERGTAELVSGRSVLDDIGLAVRQQTQALGHILDRLN